MPLGADNEKQHASKEHELAVEGESVCLFTVYGLRFIPLDKVVYTGSTVRNFGSTREREHFNLASGSRRVVTAFAQPQHQPVHDNFSVEELWSGLCTEKEARAIEQYMMDKHDTRVVPRPTNGVTKDIDLFTGKPPLQLNVVRACTDEYAVNSASVRVFRDTALAATRLPSEALAVQNRLNEMMQLTVEASMGTAIAKIQSSIVMVSAMEPSRRMAVTEIHQHFNDIFGVCVDDDGQDVRNVLRAKLLWYNKDKRGHDYSCPASVMHAELISLAAAIGIPPVVGGSVARCAHGIRPSKA
jgi:hypothetical protein